MIAEPSGGPEPRALVVTNMWPTDDDPAFGIFVRDQVEALRARLPDSTNLGTMGVHAIDVCVMDGRRNRLAYAFGVLRLRRALARPDRKYVLVHAHHALAGLAAILAGARSPRRPLVVTHHGIEVLEGWQAPLCRWVSRRADRTLVTSAAMAERLGGPTSSGVQPIDIVPCGIDRRLFRPGDRASARASLGLPPHAALAAWAGTDRPEKRLWLARAAVERVGLSGMESDARMLIVSGRPHSEVPTWLQAADALILTSTAEGSPLVVREALASGLPVVSTDVGDVRALLEGLPGCAVVGAPSDNRAAPSPSDDALASALAIALRTALDFSASGATVDAEAALAGYDADLIADRVLSIWREAVERAERPVRAPGARPPGSSGP